MSHPLIPEKKKKNITDKKGMNGSLLTSCHICRRSKVVEMKVLLGHGGRAVPWLAVFLDESN